MTFATLSAAAKRAAAIAADAGLKAAVLYVSNSLGFSLIGLGSWAMHLHPPRDLRRCDS